MYGLVSFQLSFPYIPYFLISLKTTLSKLHPDDQTHMTTPTDRPHQEKLGAFRRDRYPLMRSDTQTQLEHNLDTIELTTRKTWRQKHQD